MCIILHNILQFHQNLLLCTERGQEKCIALRLHPLVVCLGKQTVEKDIRNTAKRLLGTQHKGVQHFLSPESTSPLPVRTKSYCNTKSSKCVFIPHSAIGQEIIQRLQSGLKPLPHVCIVKGFCTINGIFTVTDDDEEHLTMDDEIDSG